MRTRSPYQFSSALALTLANRRLLDDGLQLASGVLDDFSLLLRQLGLLLTELTLLLAELTLLRTEVELLPEHLRLHPADRGLDFA